MPLTELPRHELGCTGIEVSELGLGTVKFGRNTGVKYPSRFAIPRFEALESLLEKAKSLGINYLDTAPAYGTSEQTLGELLDGNKDGWVISTKVGEYFTNDESHYDFSREATLKSISASLEKLKLDKLDLVFVHSNGEDRRVIEDTEVLPTLIDLRAQGIIKAIGFSGKTVEGSKLALDVCDVFMVALNEHDTSQTALIDLCSKHNKGVVIKKALASGHATNPDTALRYAHQYPGVTSTIVGTISEHHLEQNVEAITNV